MQCPTGKIDAHQVKGNAGGGGEGVINLGDFGVALAEVGQNCAIRAGLQAEANSRSQCCTASPGKKHMQEQTRVVHAVGQHGAMGTRLQARADRE